LQGIALVHKPTKEGTEPIVSGDEKKMREGRNSHTGSKECF